MEHKAMQQVEKKKVRGKESVPNVPREMLTPAEDHMTVTEALALEGLCGGSAIALRDASVPGGWVCGGRLWGSCGDSGHVLVVLGAVVVVVDVEREVVVERGRGMVDVHLVARRTGSL